MNVKELAKYFAPFVEDMVVAQKCAQRAIDLLTEPLSEDEIERVINLIGPCEAPHIPDCLNRPPNDIKPRLWIMHDDVRRKLRSLRVPKQVQAFTEEDDIESTSLPLIPTSTRTVHGGPQWIPWHEGDEVPELPSEYHLWLIRYAPIVDPRVNVKLGSAWPDKKLHHLITDYMIIDYTPPKVEERPKCQNGHEVVAEYAEKSGQWYWICYRCRIRSYAEHDTKDEALEAARKLGGGK